MLFSLLLTPKEVSSLYVLYRHTTVTLSVLKKKTWETSAAFTHLVKTLISETKQKQK